MPPTGNANGGSKNGTPNTPPSPCPARTIERGFLSQEEIP